MKKKSEPDPGFTERSGFKKNFICLSKLLALILLVCFISPLSDFTEPMPVKLQSLIAAFLGDIRNVIDKSAHSLTLYNGYKYGDKRSRGDRRMPEGDFYICKFLGLSCRYLNYAE